MVFAIIRGINGVVFPAIYQLPFVTLLEIVSPEKRAFINGVQSCCWTFGLCLLPAVAYLSRSWVTLSLITASMTVFLLFCWSFIPESPRWLVSRGRCEEAFGIMKKIAKKNGKTLNPSILLTKLQALDEKCKEEKLKGLKHSATDILRVPHMRKLFAFISICWTASFLAYEGLQLNVYNLTGNEFLNFFLLAVMEVPGNLASWLLMERFGRRFTLVISFIFTGLVCVLAVIEYPYSDVAISIVGKFLSAITSMATYQRSSELFPTVVRCLGLSMCSMVATIITLCIPYIVYLGVYGKSIPFLTIGICCLLAGVLSAFLPETLNKNLPQTINDAKEFGKDQKFFSFNRQKPQDRTDRQIPMLHSERKNANCMSDEENSLLDCSLQKGKIIILPRNIEHKNENNEKNNKLLSRNTNSLEEENNAINESL
ncbi:Organic cation transporter 1, partial [Stegodyphus mimosarum]